MLLVFYALFMLLLAPVSFWLRWINIPDGMVVQAVQGNIWQGSARLRLKTLAQTGSFSLDWNWCPQFPRIDTGCFHLIQEDMQLHFKTAVIRKHQPVVLHSLNLNMHSNQLKPLLPLPYSMLLHHADSNIRAQLDKLVFRFDMAAKTLPLLDWDGHIDLNQVQIFSYPYGNVHIKLDTETPVQTSTNPLKLMQQQNILKMGITGGISDLATMTGYINIRPDKRYQLELQIESTDTDFSSRIAPFSKKIKEGTYLWSYQGQLP